MITKTTLTTRNSNISREFSDRLLVAATVSYITGMIICRFWMVQLSGSNWPAGVILVLVVAVIYSRLFNIYRVILFLVVAIAGGVAFFYAVQYPAGGLVNYSGFPVTLEGTVIDEPLFYADHTEYCLRVEVVETGEGRYRVSGTLLVKIYSDKEDSYWFGERLRLRGTIVQPRGQRNPGGFDYRYYLRSRGIDALIYPNPAGVQSLGPADIGILAGSAVELRGKMVDIINRTLPSPSAELLTAILFGQRHRLSEEVEDNFRRAGAGHLMAVSGLHVGLVAAMILGLWHRLNFRGHLPLVLAIILVIAYAYLTGMRPSALRAALMVATALGALLLDREHDLPTAIAFAALITLFINPLLLFTIGFQFSYVATLALVYGYRPLERLLSCIGCPRILISPLAVTMGAQIGVLPLSVYYFHHLPAGALIFNLALLPLVAFTVGLGLTGVVFSLFAPMIGSIMLWASRPLLELMLIITEFSRLPGFYISINPPDITFLLIFYGLLAATLLGYYRRDSWNINLEKTSPVGFAKEILPGLLSDKRIRFRIAVGAVLIFAVLMIWSGILFPSQDLLTVTFIDVGQGASALIETPCGAVIMVDAGGEPAWRGNPGEIGDRVLLPFLRRKGISRIDLAVITHPHEDHFGGFIPLAEQMVIERVLISPVAGETADYHNLLSRLELAGAVISEAGEGQGWYCGEVLMLEVIGPPGTLHRGTNSDLNNNSIVFLLHYGEIRMLFTGDIEVEAVTELLRRQADLSADVLLVPHHGGYLEGMPEFLEAVGPEIAVIQVGINPFGHPHPYIISALEEKEVLTYRNDLHGAIIVSTDGSWMEITIMERMVPVP